MIQPGQRIGPFALTMSVEDLTGRLGSSEFREFGLGFLSYSRRWTDGLVGYLAENDNSKLVGLEVNDRRYQTSKGIGVGSSQGAVLLAYGLSAPRVEMTIRGLGSYRALVYNDLGVAFAVVSEENLRTRTFTQIPIGRVAWVTVFPPNSGGKIYPLPGRP